MKTKEEQSQALAVLAGVLSITAFMLYNWGILAGSGRPNVSSWMVWGFLTLLNFTSYKKMTGDWVKSILPTIGAVMCITTAILALRTGSVRALNGVDQTCLVLGVVASVCWWMLKSEKYAEAVVQVILEIALTIGFIPTIFGAINDPASEPVAPWLLWTASFSLQFFVVKLTWRGEKIDFLYPINMGLWHLVVFGLAML